MEHVEKRATTKSNGSEKIDRIYMHMVLENLEFIEGKLKTHIAVKPSNFTSDTWERRLRA